MVRVYDLSHLNMSKNKIQELQIQPGSRQNNSTRNQISQK